MATGRKCDKCHRATPIEHMAGLGYEDMICVHCFAGYCASIQRHLEEQARLLTECIGMEDGDSAARRDWSRERATINRLLDW